MESKHGYQKISLRKVYDMKNVLSSKYVLFISQLILSLIFIFSGIEKISDLNYFLVAINNYKIFPDFTHNFITVTFPWIELILGVLLLFGFYKKEISVIFSFLIFLFTLLIFISILRGLDIDCGCFGTLSSVKVGYYKIYENTILFLLAIHLYFFSKETT